MQAVNKYVLNLVLNEITFDADFCPYPSLEASLANLEIDQWHGK